jgi:hypothetical protein
MTSKASDPSDEEEPVPYLSDEEFKKLKFQPWVKATLAEKRKRWINGILAKKAKANKITKEEIIQELKEREELDRIKRESRKPFNAIQ